MIEELSKKIHGRYIVITITALMIVIGCEYLMTDEQKRQKIKEMYAIYKQKFPEVQDIDPRQAMQLSESQKIVFIDVREAEDTRAGALVAVYRHIGDHVKAGVGYNFTDFSDDLTNLDYDSQGMFFNVIGKW